MSQSASYPANTIYLNGSIPVYLNLGAFPATSFNGAMGVASDTLILYVYDTGLVAWTPMSSTSDVVGPGSATDEAVARFDGATGQIIQDSLVLITNLGAMSGVTTLDATGNVTVGTGATGSPIGPFAGPSVYINNGPAASGSGVNFRSENGSTVEGFAGTYSAGAYPMVFLGSATATPVTMITNNADIQQAWGLGASTRETQLYGDASGSAAPRAAAGATLSIFNTVADGRSFWACVNESDAVIASMSIAGVLAVPTVNATTVTIVGNTNVAEIHDISGDGLNIITDDATGSDFSGEIGLFTGDAVDGESGALTVATGPVSGTGASGLLEIYTGDTESGTSGNISIRTGTADTTRGSITLDATAVSVSTGQLSVTTAGKGLSVKEGANAKQGIATMVLGTVTVANTSITADSRIMLTAQTATGTVGAVRVSARINATSFTITSYDGAGVIQTLDISDVAYEIFEPA